MKARELPVRPAILILMLLGILLGPAYYAYCVLFSGHVTQTIEFSERASRWTTADGSILRFTNGLAYKPVSLFLSPGMNAVVLRMNFDFDEYATKGLAGKLKYQMYLSESDHTVLERVVSIAPASSGTQTVDFGPLEIPYAGDYEFVLSEVGKRANAPGLSMDVLEKARVPIMNVVWVGMGLMIVAMIISLRDLIRAATRRNPLRS
ncbi:MAG: hypothetical protein PVH25_09580 [Burkholderiales bacterium]|jgi:hypothetical protein